LYNDLLDLTVKSINKPKDKQETFIKRFIQSIELCLMILPAVTSPNTLTIAVGRIRPNRPTSANSEMCLSCARPLDNEIDNKRNKITMKRSKSSYLPNQIINY